MRTKWGRPRSWLRGTLCESASLYCPTWPQGKTAVTLGLVASDGEGPREQKGLAVGDPSASTEALSRRPAPCLEVESSEKHRDVRCQPELGLKLWAGREVGFVGHFWNQNDGMGPL